MDGCVTLRGSRNSLAIQGGQTFTHGELRQFRHRVEVQLLHDGAAVRLDRLGRDVQILADFPRGASLRQELQDLTLARTEDAATAEQAGGAGGPGIATLTKCWYASLRTLNLRRTIASKLPELPSS